MGIDRTQWNTLMEIVPSGESYFAVEIVDSFILASQKFLESLRTETDQGKRSDIAHSWKSCAYGVGAVKLGDICHEIEHLSLANLHQLPDLVKTLENEYEGVCSDLAKLRPSC